MLFTTSVLAAVEYQRSEQYWPPVDADGWLMNTELLRIFRLVLVAPETPPLMPYCELPLMKLFTSVQFGPARRMIQKPPPVIWQRCTVVESHVAPTLSAS